jgi:hypothetical protein
MAEEHQYMVVYFRDGKQLEYHISTAELKRLKREFVDSQGHGTGSYEVREGNQLRSLILRFDQVRNFG